MKEDCCRESPRLHFAETCTGSTPGNKEKEAETTVESSTLQTAGHSRDGPLPSSTSLEGGEPPIPVGSGGGAGCSKTSMPTTTTTSTVQVVDCSPGWDALPGRPATADHPHPPTPLGSTKPDSSPLGCPGAGFLLLLVPVAATLPGSQGRHPHAALAPTWARSKSSLGEDKERTPQGQTVTHTT